MRKKTTDNIQHLPCWCALKSGLRRCAGRDEPAERLLAKRFRERRVEPDRRLRGFELWPVLDGSRHDAHALRVARDARAQQLGGVLAIEPGKRRVHEDEIIDVL